MAQENASPSRSMPSIHDGAGALRRSSLGQILIDRTPQSPAPPIFTTIWEQGGNDGKGEDLLRPAADYGSSVAKNRPIRPNRILVLVVSMVLEQTDQVLAGERRTTKVGVMPLFSTWIYLCENGPKHLNQSLE